MPAEFLTIGAELISWIATYLLHSTCLMGGVWLLIRLRPTTGPAVRETLWKTALVGGLITTPAQMLLSFPAPIGGLTFTVPTWNENTVRPAPGLNHHEIENEPIPDDSRESHYGGLVLESNGTPSELDFDIEYARLNADSLAAILNAPSGAGLASGSESSETSAPIAPRLPQETLLLGLLVAAAFSFAVGLRRHLWQTVSLRRRLAGALAIDAGPARTLLDELCRAVPGTPAVRLLAAPRCSEPAAFGLRQWTIVLPARAERDLSSDELRSLLAHELAHLTRGDAWWLLVSRLVCSCGGFQPFNHLARREWQRAAEYLCDAWAVSRTGNRLALARCLTEVASWRLSQSDCAASLAATGSRSGLADRIERLVDDRPIGDPASTFRTQRRLAGAAIVVLAGLIGSGLRVNFSAAAAPELSFGDADPSSAKGSSNTGISPDNEVPATDGATATEARTAIEGSQSATVADAATSEFFSSETQKLGAALDDELRALQRELADLQPLLKQSHVPDEAKRLAELLQRESTKLEERRAKLSRSMLQSPGERRASAP